jgi:HAD superfamily hydrolase (TIGR01549 family)
MNNEVNHSKPWIFMGLGNIIFNEDPSYYQIYLMMYKAIQQRDESITFEELLDSRDEFIKKGNALPIKELIQKTLSIDENMKLKNDFEAIIEDNWLKYNPIHPKAISFINDIQAHYNLGVIANGPAFLRAIMQEVGVLKYFKSIVISEEFGISKPNKGIFLEALQIARDYCDTRNENYVQSPIFMIGDSLEHDITPGNSLNMTTIQLTWDIDLKYENSNLPKDSTFNKYLNHLKSHSSRRRNPANEKEKPDFIVKSLSELKTLLLSDKVRGVLI